MFVIFLQEDFTSEDFSHMTAPLLYHMFKNKTKYILHSAVKLRREDVVFLYLVENNAQVSDIYINIKTVRNYCEEISGSLYDGNPKILWIPYLLSGVNLFFEWSSLSVASPRQIAHLVDHSYGDEGLFFCYNLMRRVEPPSCKKFIL